MAKTAKQPEVKEPEAEEIKETKTEPAFKAPKPEVKEPEEVLTKTERIKRALAKQPKVRIMIPREKNDPVGASETVQINGYTIQIMKGEYVEVPEQIAKIIMDSQQQTEQAIARALKRIPDDERMVFDNSAS
jgi:hypothetical protein